MLKGRKSSRALLSWEEEDYPTEADKYELLEEVGRGATARVWIAHCKPKGCKVAIKLVDLEKHQGNTALDQLIQEAHVMKELQHPNLLPLHCSFICGQDMWLVMPFVAGGSLAHILATRFPEGMEEDMIATISSDVLNGLEYLHKNDTMHRDLKAANLLVGGDGRILLADFGACATLEREARMYTFQSALQQGGDPTTHSSPSDTSSPLSGTPPKFPPQGSVDSFTSWGSSTPTGAARSTCSTSSHQLQKYLSRTTFIGTSCYMAPEVLDVQEGYSQSADLWSFGIVLLELAGGRVPHAQASFTALVMSTVHDPAPRLELYAKRKFSQAMHDFVAKCLNKDPGARLGASELLRHPFLARARDERYLAQHLLGPPSSPAAALKPARTFLSRMPGGDTALGHKTVMGRQRVADAPGRTSWKAKAAAKECTVYQVVWTVYVQGRKYCIVFHMTMSHSEGRLQVNGVEVMRRKYKLWQQLNFHADSYSVAIDSPQLAPLRGKTLKVAVRAGMAGMSGQATLDGTQLDDPVCSVSYADMSPAAQQQLPQRCPVASPFSAAADNAPADTPGLMKSASAEALPSGAGQISKAASLQPSEAQPGSYAAPATAELSIAMSVPHPQTTPDQPAAIPQAVSEENLASLHMTPGQRMQAALERLDV